MKVRYIYNNMLLGYLSDATRGMAIKATFYNFDYDYYTSMFIVIIYLLLIGC
jgi:hypothetical protein